MLKYVLVGGAGAVVGLGIGAVAGMIYIGKEIMKPFGRS